MLRRLMKLTSALVISAAVLSGCAHNPSQVGLDLQRAGNMQAAYNVWKACADHGDPYCINNIGTMYENGQMNTGPDFNQAIAYYSLAARYGLPIAQQNLMRLGQQIPSADLAAVVAQQQAIQQQQQAQTNQWAAQLGSALGCAAAGGNCAGTAPRASQSNQSIGLKLCNFDYDCGPKGFCMRPDLTTQGICAIKP